MMSRKFVFLSLLLLVLIGVIFGVLSATRDTGRKSILYGAASLEDVLKAQKNSMPIHLSSDLSISTAGSQTVARQINNGAPAGIALLAHPRWMDMLDDNGRILTGSRRNLLGNRLVVVYRTNSESPVNNLSDLKTYNNRIAMGNPEAVPAGIYAREALTSANLWDPIQDQVVSFPHVRAAVSAVNSGRIPIGIVYRTDSLRYRSVSTAFEVPEAHSPDIIYPIALVRGADEQARNVYNYLVGPDAAKIFKKFGFEVRR